MVKVHLLAFRQRGKLTVRQVARLLDDSELAPLLISGEKGSSALHHVQCGALQVNVAEELAAHADGLGLYGPDGEADQCRAAGKSLVAQLSDAIGQRHL